MNKMKRFLLAAASIGSFLPTPSYAEEILSDLTYAVVLPENYDADKPYPAVLALPPGDQGRQMVEASLQSYWGHGKIHGYIVVNPIAPDGVSFLDGSEEEIPVLLDEISQKYKIEGKRFHIGGISNGGNSAFRIAEDYPKRFCSLAAFPGLPANDRDFDRLNIISDMPMLLVVGERDERWVGRMRKTQEKIIELGGNVELHVLPNVGHSVDRGFSPQQLFVWLDQQRAACRSD